MTKTVLKGRQGRTTAADDAIANPNATVVQTGEHGRNSARPENQQPTNACQEVIRVLAHRKWEAAGCPEGDGVEFWIEAEREVRAAQPESRVAQGLEAHNTTA